MSPPRLVNDFVGLLTSEQQNALEQKLEAFDRKTSTQIAVVAVDDLDGYAPGDYAQRLYDKWGIGRKGKDNGILILVKPKTAASNGQVFISVGYGLEGVAPDITAGRIIDTEMLPEFRKGDYYAGIDRAATVLMKLTEGEFTADAYGKQGDPAGLTGGLFCSSSLSYLPCFRAVAGVKVATAPAIAAAVGHVDTARDYRAAAVEAVSVEVVVSAALAEECPAGAAAAVPGKNFAMDSVAEK